MLTMRMEKTAEEYLEQIPMWAKEKNSLTDIRRFLKEMGEPDERMKIFHVAGTNGKGSVCAFLESVLRKAGYRTGTFTSPHLVETRERICIDHVMATEEAFEESFLKIRALSDKLSKEGLKPPTYFEFLFYMAMDLFNKEKPDFVILEAGLGGRLDTTNVIRKPLVSVITSISLDHTQYLGSTVEEIAWEKAGIIKEGIPVVLDGNDQSAAFVIKKRAKELKAPVYEADSVEYEILSQAGNEIKVRISGKLWQDLLVTVPFPAEYQVKNGLLALLALEAACLDKRKAVSITSQQVKEGIKAASWPARMEEAVFGVFLDGAHNPDGIKAFTKAAVRLCVERGKRALLLFSAVSDKEHEAMIRELSKDLPLDLAAVAHMAAKRGQQNGILMEELKKACQCRVEGYETVEEAVLAMLRKKDEDHLLFCVGSLYLMGEIKTVLRRNGYDRF